MRTVLGYIESKQTEFGQLPFFHFLRDRSSSPEERLIFAPAGAPFIMAFADLNKYFLPIPNPSEPLHELINVHGREDETHFSMYLKDIEILGQNVGMTFNQALEFLWSDDRKRMRQTCYVLTMLLASATTKMRIVVLEAVEAMGAVAFRTFGEVADEYRAATGRELHYFGQRHLNLESGHAMGTEGIEDQLRALVLTEDERVHAHDLVDKVFQAFSEMMNELLVYATEQRALKARS